VKHETSRLKRTAVVLAIIAIGLAVLAGTLDGAHWAIQVLWLGALAFGTLAIVALYGVAISWARYRKRLWG
jgi:hypothetical protein